jgi:hypothetical protein
MSTPLPINALDNGFIVAKAISITFSTLVRKSLDSHSTRYTCQLDAKSTIIVDAPLISDLL